MRQEPKPLQRYAHKHKQALWPLTITACLIGGAGVPELLRVSSLRDDAMVPADLLHHGGLYTSSEGLLRHSAPSRSGPITSSCPHR